MNISIFERLKRWIKPELLARFGNLFRSNVSSKETTTVEDKILKLRVRRFFSGKTSNISYLIVPKAACTSLKTAMLEIEYGKCPEMIRQIGQKPNLIHEKTFERMLNTFSPIEGNASFSFVRDPFSRFASFYRDKVLYNRDRRTKKWLEANGFYEGMSFPDCVDVLSGFDHLDLERHLIPQYLYLLDLKRKKINVDFLGKLEFINEHWPEMSKALSVDVEIGHYHAQKYNSFDFFREYPESRLKIYNYYRADFEIFNYCYEIDFDSNENYSVLSLKDIVFYKNMVKNHFESNYSSGEKK